jgi:hypothetical protein
MSLSTATITIVAETPNSAAPSKSGPVAAPAPAVTSLISTYPHTVVSQYTSTLVISKTSVINATTAVPIALDTSTVIVYKTSHATRSPQAVTTTIYGSKPSKTKTHSKQEYTTTVTNSTIPAGRTLTVTVPGNLTAYTTRPVNSTTPFGRTLTVTVPENVTAYTTQPADDVITLTVTGKPTTTPANRTTTVTNLGNPIITTVTATATPIPKTVTSLVPVTTRSHRLSSIVSTYRHTIISSYTTDEVVPKTTTIVSSITSEVVGRKTSVLTSTIASPVVLDTFTTTRHRSGYTHTSERSITLTTIPAETTEIMTPLETTITTSSSAEPALTLVDLTVVGPVLTNGITGPIMTVVGDVTTIANNILPLDSILGADNTTTSVDLTTDVPTATNLISTVMNITTDLPENPPAATDGILNTEAISTTLIATQTVDGEAGKAGVVGAGVAAGLVGFAAFWL